MTLNELKVKLNAIGIRKDAYAWGGLPNEKYVLAQNGNEWEVYYSERGSKTGLQVFTNEAEACEHMFSLLSADNSTKLSPIASSQPEALNPTVKQGSGRRL